MSSAGYLNLQRPAALICMQRWLNILGDFRYPSHLRYLSRAWDNPGEHGYTMLYE